MQACIEEHTNITGCQWSEVCSWSIYDDEVARGARDLRSRAELEMAMHISSLLFIAKMGRLLTDWIALSYLLNDFSDSHMEVFSTLQSRLVNNKRGIVQLSVLETDRRNLWGIWIHSIMHRIQCVAACLLQPLWGAQWIFPDLCFSAEVVYTYIYRMTCILYMPYCVDHF